MNDAPADAAWLFAAALAPARRWLPLPLPTGRSGRALRNDSGDTFVNHVWPGLPRRGAGVDFARLAPGQTRRWSAFPAAPMHWRKTRVRLAARQWGFITDEVCPQGRESPKPGCCTFADAQRA